MIITGLLLKIAFTDWQTKRIPDMEILFVFLFGLSGIWIKPEIVVLQRIAGGAIISVPLLLLACIVRGSIGGGDIKLMAVGGFLLGIQGVWNAFCIGVFLSGFFVIGLLITKNADRKTEIALGPFLCIGIILVFFRI